MEVDLSCAGCPRVRPQPLPDWAGAAGHAGCIGWLVADTQPGGPVRLLQVPPTPGSTCSLLIRHPFKGRIGQPQWLLFEPAAPWREGWARHARRLHQLAIVKVEPL